MIDLPNLKLTREQWDAIGRKVIAGIVAREPALASDIASTNVIDMFTRKPIWVKQAE